MGGALCEPSGVTADEVAVGNVMEQAVVANEVCSNDWVSNISNSKGPGEVPFGGDSIREPYKLPQEDRQL